MSERKINLEEICSKYEKFSKAPNLPGAIDLGYFKPTINAMMLEFGKQLLELASENANMNEDFGGGEIYNITEYKVYNDNDKSRLISVNKQSILDTIKQVE